MARLRRLLVGPEQEGLDAVRRRLDDLETEEARVARLSQLLPEAIAHRTAEDDRLAQALEPTVEATIKRSVQRDPAPLADALFPVIGPAIRKGIREALGQLLASINQTLEHSLSPRSLRWRLEAWRTGQSFAEIVLRNTLRFRVEQLFLIDRATGLPLAHVHAEAVDVHDSALVSGMLTAIQDFVHDSFGAGGGETLETLQVGELTVWVEPGPEAVLAAVLRGHPSPAFREFLRDLNETVHLRFRKELAAFEGDTAPFEGVRPLLDGGLIEQYHDEDERRRRTPLVWAGLAVLLLLGGLWLFFTLRERQQWNAYLARLAAEPGLVVLQAGWEDGRRYVRGLRDPLAAAPETLLSGTGLEAEDVRSTWAWYASLDPTILARRAAEVLEAPATVRFRVEGGTLIASGTAAPGWRERSRARAPFLSGITRYDDTAVTSDAQVRMQALADSLGRVSIRFQAGSSRLLPDQEPSLDRLTDLLNALLETAEQAGREPRIQVSGHVSREGDDAFNRALSQQRADEMVRLLSERGLPPSAFEAVGTGQPRSDQPGTDDAAQAFNRSAAFHATFEDRQP
jgi:OOP family OmpA-OmpF porin